jgi:glutaminyl-tRNA synthetase
MNELGVTKAKTNIQTARLEQYVRRYLENTVPRLMLVLEPLKVVIENLPEEWEEMIEVPFSKDPAFGVSWNADTRTSSLLT